jgi:RNA polymerase sigma factor (sigma-70 family)
MNERDAAQDVSAIVKAARAGDAAAFQRLVERFYPLVHAIAYARLGQAESAEDAAQEAFLRAYLHLDTLKDSRLFGAWMARIARNVAANAQRSSRRAWRAIPTIPLEAMTVEPADLAQPHARAAMERGQQERMVREAIAALPEDQRELVLLHYVEGLSQSEIARHLEIHPSTVGRRLDAALGSLKGVLGAALGELGRPLRSRGPAVARTVALIGSVAALSAASKATLAAEMGGMAWAAKVALGSPAGKGLVGGGGLASAGVKALMMGAAIMTVKKAVILGVVAIGLIAGGGYLYVDHSMKDIIVPASLAPEDDAAVRALFAGFQEACRSGSIDQAMTFFDPGFYATRFPEPTPFEEMERQMRQDLLRVIDHAPDKPTVMDWVSRAKLIYLRTMRLNRIPDDPRDPMSVFSRSPFVLLQLGVETPGKDYFIEAFALRGANGWKLQSVQNASIFICTRGSGMRIEVGAINPILDYNQKVTEP